MVVLSPPAICTCKFRYLSPTKRFCVLKSCVDSEGLHCPLTESLDTTEYMNGEQRPG